jgi:hypothetical protein
MEKLKYRKSNEQNCLIAPEVQRLSTFLQMKIYGSFAITPKSKILNIVINIETGFVGM